MGRQDEAALEGRSGDPELAEEEEEELVDPITVARKQCEATKECEKFRERFDKCETRVNSRSKTEEQCTEELFDFLLARDHCVAKSLFSKLK